MIGRLIVAIVVGVLVWVLCFIGGDVLAHSGIPIVKTIGDDIRDFAVVLGFLAGVLAFFTGWTPFGPRA